MSENERGLGIVSLTGFDLGGSGRHHVAQLVSDTREGGSEGGRRNLGEQNGDNAPGSKRK